MIQRPFYHFEPTHGPLWHFCARRREPVEESDGSAEVGRALVRVALSHLEIGVTEKLAHVVEARPAHHRVARPHVSEVTKPEALDPRLLAGRCEGRADLAPGRAIAGLEHEAAAVLKIQLAAHQRVVDRLVDRDAARLAAWKGIAGPAPREGAIRELPMPARSVYRASIRRSTSPRSFKIVCPTPSASTVVITSETMARRIGSSCARRSCGRSAGQTACISRSARW